MLELARNLRFIQRRKCAQHVAQNALDHRLDSIAQPTRGDHDANVDAPARYRRETDVPARTEDETGGHWLSVCGRVRVRDVERDARAAQPVALAEHGGGSR